MLKISFLSKNIKQKLKFLGILKIRKKNWIHEFPDFPWKSYCVKNVILAILGQIVVFLHSVRFNLFLAPYLSFFN